VDALEYSNLDGLALAEKVKAGEIIVTELFTLALAMSQEGLPIGVQVITNFADEAILFQIAAACEQEYRWHLRKPPIHFSDYSHGIS
jgi:Asp-tRNA(Asn)/Glu-tRNA(Gln) amidotransferase A subunit family amidase